MASHPDRGIRPTNNVGFQVTQIWRAPVVLRVPSDRRTRNRALEAAWSRTVLQSAGLGTAGRLCITIYGSRESRSSRPIQDQFAAVFDWQVRPRGLEFSAEAKGHEMEDVQSP